MLGWLSALLPGRRSFKRIVEAARRLSQGDYSARPPRSLPPLYRPLADALNDLGIHMQGKVQELLNDKEHLTSILSNMAEAVVAVDSEGRIVVANPSLSKLLGVRDEAYGRHFLEALRHSQLSQLLQTVLQEQKPHVDEVRTFNPDERVFEAHAVPRWGEGRPRGALLVLHDITRLRLLEQMRKDFVANVSHELRTPLSSIKGFAETLLAGGLNDEKNRAGFVKSIEDQADRMTRLVENLLQLSAIESGRHPPHFEPLSLGEIVQDVWRGLKPLADRKKASFVVELDEGLPKVSADRGQLRQVLTNLVENAVKFSQEGGQVRVAAKVESGTLLVSITDSGPGIPEKDLPRVFERFYRVDKARSREMGGTGLGLAIVKHIIEAHHGSVGVESAEGQGSTFRFTLPLA